MYMGQDRVLCTDMRTEAGDSQATFEELGDIQQGVSNHTGCSQQAAASFVNLT